jgi:hypothetical protein
VPRGITPQPAWRLRLAPLGVGQESTALCVRYLSFGTAVSTDSSRPSAPRGVTPQLAFGSAGFALDSCRGYSLARLLPLAESTVSADPSWLAAPRGVTPQLALRFRPSAPERRSENTSLFVRCTAVATDPSRPAAPRGITPHPARRVRLVRLGMEHQGSNCMTVLNRFIVLYQHELIWHDLVNLNPTSQQTSRSGNEMWCFNNKYGITP